MNKIAIPRRKKSKMYFGKPCQDAIIRYNSTDNTAIKNRNYSEHIDFPFNKLSKFPFTAL